MSSACPAAIAEGSVLRIADRPTTIGVGQGQEGGGRHQLRARDSGGYWRARRTRRPGAGDRTGLTNREPATIGSTERPGRRGAIAPGYAHSMNFANHCISTNTAKLSCDLAGAFPFEPHLFQLNDSSVRPVVSSRNIGSRHVSPHFYFGVRGDSKTSTWLTIYLWPPIL